MIKLNDVRISDYPRWRIILAAPLLVLILLLSIPAWFIVGKPPTKEVK